MWENILSLAGLLLALAFVLFLIWLSLKWMNKFVPGYSTASKRLINVMDRVTIGKSSSLVLVRVKDKVILIAFNEHSSNVVAEFDDPNGEIKPEDITGTTTFSAALKESMKKIGFGNGKNKTGGGGI